MECTDARSHTQTHKTCIEKRANGIRKKNAAHNFFFDLNERRNDGMNKVIVVLGLNQSRIFGYIHIHIRIRIRIYALRVYSLCFAQPFRILCGIVISEAEICRVSSFNYFVLPFTKSFAAGFFADAFFPLRFLLVEIDEHLIVENVLASTLIDI